MLTDALALISTIVTGHAHALVMLVVGIVFLSAHSEAHVPTTLTTVGRQCGTVLAVAFAALGALSILPL